MKTELTIKAKATTLCVAWLLAGCASPQIWYAPDKPPTEAYRDLAQAQLEAQRMVKPPIEFRSVFQQMADGGKVKDYVSNCRML